METENTSQQANQAQIIPENQPTENVINNQRGNVPIIIGGIVLLLVVGIGAFVLGQRINSNQSTTLNQQPQATISNTAPQPSPTLFPASTPDTIPQENALYYGTYDGIEAIFVTNSTLSHYFEGGVEKTSFNIGSLEKDNGSGLSPFDYKNLKNPKKILVLPSNVQQVNGFKLSDDKMFVYISITLGAKTSDPNTNNLDHIYKVNLNNLTSEDLWSVKLDSPPDKYKGAHGAGYVKQISADNNYIVLSIHNCYACSGSEVGELVLNNKTKSEKYYEGIGNVQFNLSDGIFTYQKLAPFKEPCDPSPRCDSDNTQTVYKPSGQVFTEKLP